MLLLDASVDWTGFLPTATQLVWWAGIVAGAAAGVLALCFCSMIVSEARQSPSLPPESEFMGFGHATPGHLPRRAG